MYIYTVDKLRSSETCVNLHASDHSDDMNKYFDCFENAVNYHFATFYIFFFDRTSFYLQISNIWQQFSRFRSAHHLENTFTPISTSLQFLRFC